MDRLDKIKVALAIALMGLTLTGCATAEVPEVPEEPIGDINAGVIAEAQTEVKLDRTEIGIPRKERTKEVANYLGDIPLEDYNPELPTQRKEGYYTPSIQEDGVWYWDYNESNYEGEIPPQRLPFGTYGEV